MNKSINAVNVASMYQFCLTQFHTIELTYTVINFISGKSHRLLSFHVWNV